MDDSNEVIVSGVGVIDKAVALLDHIASEPRSLAELVEVTGISRATAHRLASALESHRLLRRRDDGRFVVGPWAVELGRAGAEALPLAELAGPAVRALRDETGESAQLYVRDGEGRVCVVSLESPHGLRTIVRTGERLPIDRGSAGHALTGSPDAGVFVSRAEREPGVGSVSAPVVVGATVIAAVGVSGPLGRMSEDPAARFGAAVNRAATAIAAAVEA